MVIVLACGALIASRYLPLIIPEETANRLIYQGLLIAAYALIGVVVLYALGVLLLLIAHGRELMDKRQFEEPVALVARSAENAKKYEREEGGNNRFQNHLASLTLVKPGFVHGIALRGTLFLINLLSRFWFNIGTLGDIPTILSARWILIDSGRRLLFLDNYGGAWNSYLNEFIDMDQSRFPEPRSADDIQRLSIPARGPSQQAPERVELCLPTHEHVETLRRSRLPARGRTHSAQFESLDRLRHALQRNRASRLRDNEALGELLSRSG